METVTDFFFFGGGGAAELLQKVTGAMKLKKKLPPWEKSYDKHSLSKSRDITLLTKVHLVKAMVFPVVMYGYDSLTMKKAEHRRIDAFELLCCGRLLRVLWCKWNQTSQF